MVRFELFYNVELYCKCDMCVHMKAINSKGKIFWQLSLGERLRSCFTDACQVLFSFFFLNSLRCIANVKCCCFIGDDFLHFCVEVEQIVPQIQRKQGHRTTRLERIKLCAMIRPRQIKVPYNPSWFLCKRIYEWYASQDLVPSNRIH